jgi:hypothetical protein
MAIPEGAALSHLQDKQRTHVGPDAAYQVGR